MPLRPEDIAQHIGSSEFQAMGVEDQHANLRGLLDSTDERVHGLGADEQDTLTNNLLQRYTPSKLGNFIESGIPIIGGVPILSGLVSGSRAFERGQPLSMVPAFATGGRQPTSALEQGLEEMGGQGAVLGAVEAVTGGLGGPAIEALTSRAIGLGGKTVAGLIGESLAAAQPGVASASVEALNAAGALGARKALQSQFATTIGRGFTAGEMFGAVNAASRAYAGAPQDPVEDFVRTPLGIAAFSALVHGAGYAANQYGIRNIGPIAADLAEKNPGFAEYAAGAPPIMDAMRRVSAGKVTPEAAGQILADAVRGPLDDPVAADVLKRAMRAYPETLDSNLGVSLLQRQRERLVAPDVQVTPYERGLRVTYDDSTGRSVTELLSSNAEQAAFAKRVAAGEVVVDSATGDDASIVRSGVRQGTPLEARFGPGGGPGALAPEGTTAGPGGPFEPVSGQLPAVRPEVADLHDTVDQAAQEMRSGAAFGQVPHEVPGPGLPSWVRDTVTQNHEQAIRMGIADQVETLARKGRTAKQIVSAIPELRALRPDDAIGLVRSVRIARAIPNAEDLARTPASPSDLGTSPEVTNRLGVEKVQGITYARVHVRRGSEEPLPAMAGREDMLARRNEIIIRRKPGEAPSIVDVGPGVSVQDRVNALKNLQNQIRVAPKQAALPAPTGEYGLVGDQVVHLRPSEPIVVPPSGTDVRITRAAGTARIVGAPDALGRVAVDLGNNQIVRAPWRSRTGTVDVEPSLIDAAARAPGEPAVASKMDPRQVRPGQLIHQTVRDMDVRGVRPSIEIIKVDGDQVTIRVGSESRVVPMSQIASTIDSGVGKFAFDATAPPDVFAEAQAERFNARVREGRFDGQMADELWSYDKQAGQRAGPAATARDVADGVDKREAARENTPREQRTEKGNPFVKGCK